MRENMRLCILGRYGAIEIVLLLLLLLWYAHFAKYAAITWSL